MTVQSQKHADSSASSTCDGRANNPFNTFVEQLEADPFQVMLAVDGFGSKPRPFPPVDVGYEMEDVKEIVHRLMSVVAMLSFVPFYEGNDRIFSDVMAQAKELLALCEELVGVDGLIAYFTAYPGCSSSIDVLGLLPEQYKKRVW